MTKFGRSTTISWLFFGVLSCGHFPGTDAPTRSRTDCKTMALIPTGKLKRCAIRSLDLPDLKVNLFRTWTWEPKTGQVTYETKDKDGKPVKVTYNRSHSTARRPRLKDEIEPAFVNDNYWFIFPFHAYWDTSANVTVKDKQKLPIGRVRRAGVGKYPMEVGGYTPGDTWDLYVGRWTNFAVLYHRADPKKPSNVTTTWAGYKKGGPLLVSTDHRGGRRTASRRESSFRMCPAR